MVLGRHYRHLVSTNRQFSYLCFFGVTIAKLFTSASGASLAPFSLPVFWGVTNEFSKPILWRFHSYPFLNMCFGGVTIAIFFASVLGRHYRQFLNRALGPSLSTNFRLWGRHYRQIFGDVFEASLSPVLKHARYRPH